MKRSINRILTTHVGSLPRSPDMIDLMRAVGRGEPFDARRRDEMVKTAVFDAVARQIETGVDIVSDGEMGKPGFINYTNDRLGGFERAPANTKSMWSGTRETNAFPEFYKSEIKNIDRRLRMQCVAPITYKGHALIQRRHLAASNRRWRANATKKSSFLRCRRRSWPTTSATCSTRPTRNTSSRSPRRCARNTRRSSMPGFMRADRRPAAGVSTTCCNPDLTIERMRASGPSMRVEALNHALRGIPPEKVRHHTCYGINMGPRVHDMELKDLVDDHPEDQRRRLFVRGGQPAPRARVAGVGGRSSCPRARSCIPGRRSPSRRCWSSTRSWSPSGSSASPTLVGRENVIAGADCGFASSATSKEIHPTVVWAKFEALVEGARIASQRLWKS